MNVILSPEAVADLDEIHAYIHGFNPDAAHRLLTAAFETFDVLARTPQIGRLRLFPNPVLHDLRSFVIRRFRNYVVFYRVLPDRIEVVRVLHGARALREFFSED
jgi:toxin ParE1/3/4